MKFYQAGVAFFVLVVGAGLFTTQMFSHGELAEAPNWALLQGIESEHRDKLPAPKPVLLRLRKGEVVLGLSTGQPKLPMVWITLNNERPDGAGSYVMPGASPISLSCKYLRELSSTVEIKPAPQRLLKSHCFNS